MFFCARRKLANVLVPSKRLTSTYECCTKPSVSHMRESVSCSVQQALQSIRKIPFASLNNIEKQPFAKGVYGKCFYASMSASIKVCIKAFRTDKHLVSAFPLEAVITSNLCHPNLPWIYGIMEHENHMMLVLSFHGIGGNSCTIHKALHYSQKDIGFDATKIDWKVIILGMISALKYLHDHDILHNDIKADNILLDDRSSSYRCVVIDFGKSCFAADGRSYSLSEKERRRYSLEHPQVAPDLRDGHCKQSQFSDVYALGRVLKQINDKFLKIPFVASQGSLCTTYLCSKRPTMANLYIAMHNMFQI